jgi:hypothetical protein
MKSKRYKTRFISVLALVIIVHVVLLCTGIFHLPLKNLFLMDGFLLTLFFLSSLIIAPGLDKEGDNFVNRFLILTTLQLFAMMIVVLVLSVLKMDYFKIIGYHLLIVFICLLVAQSLLLLSFVRKVN